MKLIKQTKLGYQQGTSDKVYEVDLCETGPDQFVVNFRYGRRGSTLREGTKTTSPVSRNQAEQIFDDLVRSKTAKGYQGQTGVAELRPDVPETSPTATELPPHELHPRDHAILNRLSQGEQKNLKWKLSRAVWRAGELRLSAAEPMIRAMIGREVMLDYACAWSLGRIGLNDSFSALHNLADEDSRPPHVRQIAMEACRMVANEAQRDELINRAIETLPSPLDQFARNQSPDAFKQAFLEQLQTSDLKNSAILQAIYFIDNDAVRPALLEALKSVGLEVNYFRAIRRIFKVAEMRRDAEVFGLIAYRFETFHTRFRMPYYYSWGNRNRKKPTIGDDACEAFSVQTRNYFRRRVWAILDRMGNVQDKDYVPMAVGTLLPFTDDDATNVRTDSRYNWQTRQIVYAYTDIFGLYWAFNQILYRNSPRYQPVTSRQTFRVADSYEPGCDPPDSIEAAFPVLWLQEPRGLLHLLTDSRCAPVNEFAAKAIRECKSFCASLDLEVVKILLASAYDVTVALGLDLAIERYDAKAPDKSLVLLLANCGLPRGRDTACSWIKSGLSHFFSDVDFVFALITSPYPEPRAVARDSISMLPSDDASIQSVVARSISFLAALKVDDESELESKTQLAQDVSEILLKSFFARQVKSIGQEVICDLLAHSLPPVQMLGGEIVTRHESLARSPTEPVLRAMLGASYPAVRALGVKVIAGLPDRELTRSVDLLAMLSCHELADIRDEARPVVNRLIRTDSRFGRELADELIRRLLIPGAPEGVPSHTSRILREDFSQLMQHVSKDTVWRLLQSRSAPAQEVGGVLLATNVRSDSLDITEIVKLTNHDVLTVRQASWKMYAENVERMRRSLGTAVRILDSKWDDSRNYGFEFLTHEIREDDLTCDVLISICDSVREDVQQFGREMITKRFVETDGEEYLYKLSEHPSTDLQMFASNFLTRFGADRPDRLRELSPFFVSILSRVNKGRVAKNRVLAFLREEALKSEAAAKTIAEILGRISATCAVGDKAATIEAMVEIRDAYPGIELPIKSKKVEVR